MEKANKIKIVNRLSLFIFYSAILFFFIGFNFQDNRMNGWFPQYLTSLPAVAQLQFLDSLNGYYLGDNQEIYKTTNSGNNWSLFANLGDTMGIRKFQFLGRDTIVLCASFSILKTTNAGINWLYYPFPQFSDMIAYDMHAFSTDSIWIAGTNVFNAKIYLSTNGGLSWTTKFTDSRSQFDKLYFFNRRIGFTCLTTSSDIFKTTNGGDNWFVISEQQFRDINFVDSLTGWKSYGTIKKTTNGGINWITQYMPSGGIISNSTITRFSVVNKDTLWGCGGEVYIPIYLKKGIIYKTTNGGDNWGYQLPDTNIVKYRFYSFSNFLNKNIGWEYNGGSSGVHTTVGGNDTTIYTNIKEQITNIASDFVLNQNYPNPFNPVTSIKYQVLRSANIKLIVFDITGKEIKTLVNKKQSSGTYEIKFDARHGGLSSGIYFYSLFADGVRVDTKKSILIK